MSEVALQRGWAVPWATRWSTASSLAPVWLALGVALGWLGLNVVWGNVFGYVDGLHIRGAGILADRGWWERIVEAGMMGYTIAIGAWSVRGAQRRLDELRPVLALSADAIAQLRVDLGSLPRWIYLAAGLLGAAIVGTGPPEAPTFRQLAMPEITRAEVALELASQTLLGWLMLRAMALNGHIARQFSIIGQRHVRIDLLDLAPVAPFARVGLLTVLLWAVWFSLVSLAWLRAGPRTAELWSLLGILPLAVFALLVPVLGLHRRIRAKKRAELARIDARIRLERDALGDLQQSGAASQLPTLVAYRSLVERVREWPFDVSTLVRFAAYVLIVVGSWLGAALVERVLGLVIDR